MPRLLLVANPSASGFTGALHRDVAAELSRAFELVTVWPDSAQAARRAAADAAAVGFDIVAAMGGDGVAHAVVNGVVGTDTALGIIPVGTTNVLARILGLPTRPRRAARRLTAGSEARRVGVAAAVAEHPDGTTATSYGMFAVGLGFDAELVQAAEARPHGKLWFGGVYYARSAIGVLWSRFRSRPATLRVEAAGRRADGVAVMVQIHDIYTYFGAVPLGLGTRGTDGLDVAVFERLDPRAVARVMPRLALRRSLDGAAGVQVWPGVAKVVVEADPPALLQADGELLGTVSAVEIAPAPLALLVA